MAIEQVTSNNEILDATQNAVIEAADNVAEAINIAAHDIHGSEAFYEHPTFWVAVSFVLVILLLGKPVGKIVKSMLKARVAGIAKRIDDAANLRDDAQKLLVEYERKFANAKNEANEILERSKKEIELLKKESLNKLKTDIAIKEKEAEIRLASAQGDAVVEISSLTSDLTIKTVKKVIAEKLSAKNQDELIEQSIKLISKV